MQKPEELSPPSLSTPHPAEAVHRFYANAPIDLLRIILLRIVNSEQENSEFTRLLNSRQTGLQIPITRLNLKHLPVKRLRQSTQIIYRSPAPRILAAGDEELQQAIAAAFCKQFRTLPTDLAVTDEDLLLLRNEIGGITVRPTLQGELEFVLQDTAIADWLNYLLHPSFTLPAISTPHLPNLAQRTFPIQHAHARCCALLQLADVVGTERSPTQTQSAARPQRNDGSAWCWSAVRLQALTPAENVLVHRLLALLDEWVDEGGDRAKQCFRLAEAVAVAFDQVDRDCQLFSPAMQQNGDRRQTYLLVLLTTRQAFCQCLHGLGFTAPTAL